MSADTWQAIAASATVLVALFGLYFLIIELRALQRSLQGGAHAAIYAQAPDFRAHIVERPHLRKYFFFDGRCGRGGSSGTRPDRHDRGAVFRLPGVHRGDSAAI